MAGIEIIREGKCQHPSVMDGTIEEATFEEPRALYCDDCHEHLYPHLGDDDVITVYVGEPWGAGRDPAGRPSHITNPEAWTE